MVKRLLWLLFCCSTLLAATPLSEKVQSLIGPAVYAKNSAYIDILFSNADAFVKNGKVDSITVVETLQENGLLDLFFKEPREIELTFTTNGSALFFVKLIEDTLHEMGYYRYLTKETRQDQRGFVWTIILTSEQVTDPVILRRQLQRRGCDIIDLDREGEVRWYYGVDMSDAHLNVERLADKEQCILKRSLYAQWLDVSDVKKVHIWSLGGNRWYPYIAFYNRSLQLLKLYKRDKKTLYTAINLPRDTTYIKVGDIYTLKNIKDGLKIEAEGKK